MTQAHWEGATLAESEGCVVVEGNSYFPPESVRREFLVPSETTTVCPWKGTAHYYHVVVEGKRNPDAAWFYPDPKPAAMQIKDRIAFWHGVRVASAT